MIEEILKDMPFDEKVEVFNKITQELYDWLGVNHPSLNVQLVPADKVAEFKRQLRLTDSILRTMFVETKAKASV